MLLNLRISQEDLGWLDEQARRRRTSRSEVVRELIRERRSPYTIRVDCSDAEYDFIKGVAERSRLSPSDAVRYIIFSFKTLLESPLSDILSWDRIFKNVRGRPSARGPRGRSPRTKPGRSRRPEGKA